MRLMQKIKNAILCLTLAATIAGCTTAKQSGSVSAYYDSRGKQTATVTGCAYDLPLDTKLFGFVEIETEKQNQDNLKKPYTELRLSKKAKNGLGVAAEYNKDFSLPDETTRLGLVYEPDLSDIVSSTNIGLKFYPVSSNNKGMQLGLYGKKSFNQGNIYVGGFLDYNFKPNKIVSEIQLGKRIADNLYFVVEGRYSGFIEKNNLGIAAGLEWKFK